MPTPAQTGPFSYDTYNYSSSSNNRVFTITKSAYNTDNGETFEVYAGGTLLDPTSATAGYPQYVVNTGQTAVTINSNVTIANGAVIKLQRVSNRTSKQTDFAPGSVIREADLDNSASQTFHIAQEAYDTAKSAMIQGSDLNYDAQSKKIVNVANPDNPNDVANKAYVDGTSTTATVSAIANEVTTVAGISDDVTALAGVVKETVTYTVTVSNSKFFLNGGEFSSATTNPVLNLQRGSTYKFNYSDNSVSSGSHALGFSSTDSNTAFSGATAYTTGVTDDTVNKIITLVVDASAPSTLYYYCTNSSHNAMGNTMNIAEDSIEVVADNIANVNKVAAVDSNVTTVAGIDSNVTTVAGIHGNVTTVATLGTNGADVTTVAGKSTEIDVLVNKYDGSTTATSGTNKNITQVDTVADAIANVNSVATNISQVTTFADTYHTAGTTEPSGSNVTEGDLWFDTANDVLKVYDGSSWASASSSIATVASQNEFTASDGQGTGNKYFALNHDVGLELVFLNGVRLKRGSDYYCTNSNTSTTPIASGNAATFVRLETVPGSSDILSVMAFGQIANNLAVNTAGGTFTGGVTFKAGTTHNTGSNTFTMPTTRGTDSYVLTRDDSVGTGGTAWKETALAPTITSIKYSEQTSGTFVENTGQTATEASASTPELCQIIGTNFDNSMTITVGGTSAGSVFINSSTQATFTPPSKTAGSYTLIATNPNGLTANISISYDADPAWVTASAPSSSLGNFVDGLIAGTNGPQIVASESGSNLITGYKQVTSNTDNTVITSGVAGLTIGDNGYLTGTLAGTNGATNNFYAIAVDNEGQQSAIRQFKFVSYDYSGSGGQFQITGNVSGTNTRIHIFKNASSSFSVIANITNANYIIVGGGGGGGGDNGGGGGAGALRSGTVSFTAGGVYTVQVGAGGAYQTKGSDSSLSVSSGDSGFSTITAEGGGEGGTNNLEAGQNGGSGGGGCGTNNSAYNGAGSATNSSYGSSGATGYQNSSINRGGGGGGAVASGGSDSDPYTSKGGDGSSAHSAILTVINADSNVTDTIGESDSGTWYLAGGGGGGSNQSQINIGGKGGGGRGQSSVANLVDALDYTGGGGAGRSQATSGGAGGSGIVIISYAI